MFIPGFSAQPQDGLISATQTEQAAITAAIQAQTNQLTGYGAWLDAGAASIVEFNRTMSSFTKTNSHRILTGLSDNVGTTDISKTSLISGLRLKLNAAASASDILLLTATRLENNNAAVFAAMNWKELYS